MNNKTITTENKWYEIIWAVVLFTFSIALVISLFAFFSSKSGEFPVDDLSDGWDISFQGKQYHDVSRYDKRFSDLNFKRNDVITMERRIDFSSSALDDDRVTIRVYSRLSSIRVSIVGLDGRDRLLYFYGYDKGYSKTGSFLGSGYHFIQLPQNCYGMTLKIIEMASQDDAIQSLPEVLATPSSHAMEQFARDRGPGTFITVFLVMAGAILTIISLSMAIVDRGFIDLCLLGLFSMFGGLWSMCALKAIEFFSQDIKMDSMIEYLSLYIFAVPLLALALRFLKKISYAVKVFIFASMIANAAVLVAAIISQKTGLANIDFLLPIFHVLLSLDAVVMVTVSILRWKKASLSEKIFEMGIYGAAILGVVYILYYYLIKRHDYAPGIFDNMIMPLALLSMTIFFLIAYIVGIYMKRIDKTQRKRLQNLAYKDDLTGLLNRTKGEQILSQLGANGQRYLVINFDLNFLKRTNDRFGHATGDKYLKSFAGILTEVFSDATGICRMGGDEFMVAYQKAPDEKTVQEKLSQMKKLESKEEGSSPDGVIIDAAYGYAYSDENEKATGELIYSIADRKMYEMKFESKKGRSL